MSPSDDLYYDEQEEAERRWARAQAARFGLSVRLNLENHLDLSAVENARCAARWAFEARPDLCPGWLSPLERLQRARPQRLGIWARLRSRLSSWGLLRSVRGILKGGGR